jgi:hypothetical protein
MTLWVTSDRFVRVAQCPLYSDNDRIAALRYLTQWAINGSGPGSFDHLVGACKHSARDGEPERPAKPHVAIKPRRRAKSQ